MPMKKLTTLVVDDEPLARERLMGLLAAESDVEVLGECRDGEEAVSAIHERHPDLVLLDVEMPRMNGFQVIDTIGPDQMPMVIFVTAYDQHAIRAFQVRALDYLLKPFDRERFTDALQRARTHLESQTNGDLGRRLMALMKDMKRDPPKTDRLVVKSGGRLFFLQSGRDRLDRGGRQLRPPARRQPGAPAARDDERHRGTAGFGALLPHPPLTHRQRRTHPGDAALAERRVLDRAALGDPADAQSRLSGAAAGPAENLTGRFAAFCNSGSGL